MTHPIPADSEREAFEAWWDGLHEPSQVLIAQESAWRGWSAALAYARAAPVAGEPVRSVTLNGHELANALFFLNPDGDQDTERQRDESLVIEWLEGGPEDDDGKAGGPSYYAWMAEYPEEGCIPLRDDDSPALNCLAPAPARAAVPDGFRLIPTSALLWLHGEEGDFECAPQHYFRGKPPPYWWRSEFRRRIAAAPAPPPAAEPPQSIRMALHHAMHMIADYKQVADHCHAFVGVSDDDHFDKWSRRLAELDQRRDAFLPVAQDCLKAPAAEPDYKRERDEAPRIYLLRADARPGDNACWAMHCPKHDGGCGVQINADSRAEAISAWNRRASLPADAPQAGRVVEPVAWMVADKGWNQCFTTLEQASAYGKDLIPLYATPPSAPPAAATVWLCAKCGFGSEEHGMPGHSAYQCVADMRPAAADAVVREFSEAVAEQEEMEESGDLEDRLSAALRVERALAARRADLEDYIKRSTP